MIAVTTSFRQLTQSNQQVTADQYGPVLPKRIASLHRDFSRALNCGLAAAYAIARA